MFWVKIHERLETAETLVDNLGNMLEAGSNPM